MPQETKQATQQSLTLILIVLGVVNLVNFMDRVLFSLMIEPVKAELQLSDGQMGLLGGIAFAAVYAVGGLMVGRIADRNNRVGLIGVSLTVWSAATAACGMANSFVQMFISRMFVGAGEAGCVPAAQSLISDVAPAKKRALMLSIFTGVGTVGTLLGIVVGGALIEAIGWRMTFIAFGAIGIIPLLLLMFTLRDPRTIVGAQRPPASTWRQDVSEMLKQRETQLVLVGIPLIYTIVGVSNWIPAFFQRTYGITTEEFSSVGGVYLGVGLVLGTFAGGIIANKLISRDVRWEFWWTSLSCTLALVPLMFVYFANDLQIAYLGLFGAFFLAGSSFGPSMACIHTITKQSVRATAIASMAFTTALMSYGGLPVIIGFLSDAFANNGVSVEDGSTLKYALALTMVFPPIASVLFLMASNRVYETSHLRQVAHHT